MKINKRDLIKNNRFLYRLYRFFMSIYIFVIKIFVKTNNKRILFVSYGGRYFNDSPLCIYKEMLTDKRFLGFDLVWAFIDPRKFDVKRSVKIDSFRYYVTALSSRCWITNVSVERGVSFKGKKVYYFHTTHTVFPKLMGHDQKKGSFFGWDFKYRFDCSCAQSELEKRYQMNMFGLREDQILVCGYPKNDALLRFQKEDRVKILNHLGLPTDKKIVMYAPTFRDDDNCLPPIFNELERVKKELADDYIILFRLHPIIADKISVFCDSNFMFDVSNYSDNTELLFIADMLISDYSGIFFEYGVLRKPMITFAYDYDDYQIKRGLYFDLRKELPSANDVSELITKIKQFNDSDVRKVINFDKKYITVFGNATRLATDRIFQEIVKKD